MTTQEAAGLKYGDQVVEIWGPDIYGPILKVVSTFSRMDVLYINAQENEDCPIYSFDIGKLEKVDITKNIPPFIPLSSTGPVRIIPPTITLRQ